MLTPSVTHNFVTWQAYFAWQAWHLATSTFASHGRRGTWTHLPAFGVAGVALGDFYLPFAWQAWPLRHWAGSGGALGRACSPVTPWYFACQAWHLATSTFASRGTRGTWRHPPSLRGRRGTWRHPPSFCVAGVALVALHATLYTTRNTTEMLPGAAFQVRKEKTDLALVARLGADSRPGRRATLRGRRGTW